jgi:hypothetical protein
MDKLKNNKIKYLDEYKDFIKQFEMVGSNVLYLSNDGYLENIQTGYSSIEKEEFTTMIENGEFLDLTLYELSLNNLGI